MKEEALPIVGTRFLTLTCGSGGSLQKGAKGAKLKPGTMKRLNYEKRESTRIQPNEAQRVSLLQMVAKDGRPSSLHHAGFV
jgi:hypothetical protein